MQNRATSVAAHVAVVRKDYRGGIQCIPLHLYECSPSPITRALDRPVKCYYRASDVQSFRCRQIALCKLRFLPMLQSQSSARPLTTSPPLALLEDCVKLKQIFASFD